MSKYPITFIAILVFTQSVSEGALIPNSASNDVNNGVVAAHNIVGGAKDEVVSNVAEADVENRIVYALIGAAQKAVGNAKKAVDDAKNRVRDKVANTVGDVKNMVNGVVENVKKQLLDVVQGVANTVRDTVMDKVMDTAQENAKNMFYEGWGNIYDFIQQNVVDNFKNGVAGFIGSNSTVAKV